MSSSLTGGDSDSTPSHEGKRPVELVPDTIRNVSAAYSVEAIASGNVPAGDPVGTSAAVKRNRRVLGGDVVKPDVVNFVKDRHPVGVQRTVEVTRNLGLSVNGNRPADQLGEIDAEMAAIVGKQAPAVYKPFPVQPL